MKVVYELQNYLKEIYPSEVYKFDIFDATESLQIEETADRNERCELSNVSERTENSFKGVPTSISKKMKNNWRA